MTIRSVYVDDHDEWHDTQATCDNANRRMRLAKLLKKAIFEQPKSWDQVAAMVLAERDAFVAALC